MTDTVKLLPEVKALWLTALRSGDYMQGTGYLAYRDDDPDEDGERPMLYCCLGVLCDVAVQAGVDVTAAEREPVLGVMLYDQHEGDLPASVWRWATGLADSVPGGDFDVQVPNQDEPGETYGSRLADENDNGRDFAYIADLIEGQL